LSGIKHALGLGRQNPACFVGRRDWLRAVVGVLGVVLLEPSFFQGNPSPGDAKLEDWLRHLGADVLGNGAALGRIGGLYLDANPGESNRRRLTQLLSGEETTEVGLTLIQNIARNWVDHDVVVVDGWVMARAEARICAVLHLMEGAHG
jgi:hypothetical protein